MRWLLFAPARERAGYCWLQQGKAGQRCSGALLVVARRGERRAVVGVRQGQRELGGGDDADGGFLLEVDEMKRER